MVDIIEKYWKTYVVKEKTPHKRVYYDDDKEYTFHEEYDMMVHSIVDTYYKKVVMMCKNYSITEGMIVDAEKEYYAKTRQITGSTWSDAQYSSKAFQIVYITRKIVRRIIMSLQICRDADRYGILKKQEHTLFVVGGGPCFEGAVYRAYLRSKCGVDVLTVNFDKNDWQHVTSCDKFVCDLFDSSIVSDKDEIFTSYVLEHHVSLDIQSYIDRGINVYSIEKEYFKRCHPHRILGDSRMKDTSKVVFCEWKYNPRKCRVNIPAIIIGKEMVESRKYEFLAVIRPQSVPEQNEVVESFARLQAYPRPYVLCVGQGKVMSEFVREYKMVGYILATKSTVCQALSGLDDNSLNTVVLSDVVTRSQSVELTHILDSLVPKMAKSCTVLIIDYMCDRQYVDQLQYNNMVKCAKLGKAYKYYLRYIRYYRPIDEIDAMMSSYDCDRRCVTFSSRRDPRRHTIMYNYGGKSVGGSACDGIAGMISRGMLYEYAFKYHGITVSSDKLLYEYHRSEVFK